MEVKRMAKNVYSFALLSILLCATVVASSVAAQVSTDQKTKQEARNATDIINANQILKLWQNESTQVGIGTVQDVTCKLEELGKGQTIFTYAEISVEVPLTDNLIPEQIIVAKYLGGQTEKLTLRVDILWPFFPNDTVTPPSMFRLSKGQSILFFVEEATNTLAGYLPYKTANSADIDHLKLLSTEPQPTTGVPESDGYGFAANFASWGDYIEWSDLPWQYQIDPDGTPDILGNNEFEAIRAAFSTWENAPYCGVDFVEGNQYDPGDTLQDYATPDGHNSIGWVPDFQGNSHPLALGLSYNDPQGAGHIIETNVILNDYYTWRLGDWLPWEYVFDVQSTLTHEIGHAIGLADLYAAGNEQQTMWNTGPYRSTDQRSLEWGDFNGAHYLYPEHDDAGSGGDAGDSYIQATYVNRNVWYYGRLCNLPGDLDNYDYFKFYATSGMAVFVRLYPPTNANFDLELRDPNNNLVAYSRNEGNGAEELIIRSPMGISGFWYVTIYTSETNRQESNGQYQFFISDYGAKYVSSIYWAGWLSGLGYVLNAPYETGSSPDGSYAGIYTLYEGDAATIMGYLNSPTYYPSNIYIYGYSTGNPHVFVYVSQNANYDWYYVNDLFIQQGLSTTIHLGHTTQQFRYIAIALYNDGGGLNILNIDCVTMVY
jgi:hypothetical protein